MITEIRGELDPAKRKELCSEVKKIMADELPYVPLWYVVVVSVQRRGMRVELTPKGDFDFLVQCRKGLGKESLGTRREETRAPD